MICWRVGGTVRNDVCCMYCECNVNKRETVILEWRRWTMNTNSRSHILILMYRMWWNIKELTSISPHSTPLHSIRIWFWIMSYYAASEHKENVYSRTDAQGTHRNVFIDSDEFMFFVSLVFIYFNHLFYSWILLCSCFQPLTFLNAAKCVIHSWTTNLKWCYNIMYTFYSFCIVE